MAGPFTIKSDTLTPGLKAFFKQAGVGAKADRSTADFRARQKVGLQLLNFCAQGSSKEPVVPPIETGVLRASASVFVDDVLIGDTKALYPDGTPSASYESKDGGITVGYNTAYAARMHETTWTPGGARPNRQAVKNPSRLANVGNKWVERHLKADGETLLGMYADLFRREMRT